MKVTLILVTSLDGRITEGDKPGAGSWASPEDQEVFLSQIEAHDCIVMGSTTYEAARSIIKPSANKPRIVLTRTPQRFASERQPGLEFLAISPQEVIRRAENNGYKSLLLVGGARTNARFLDADLVDELSVTIEPLLFGAGTPFVAALRQTLHLQLLSCKQINSQGALLARYRIQKFNQGPYIHENKEI